MEEHYKVRTQPGAKTLKSWLKTRFLIRNFWQICKKFLKLRDWRIILGPSHPKIWDLRIFWVFATNNIKRFYNSRMMQHYRWKCWGYYRNFSFHEQMTSNLGVPYPCLTPFWHFGYFSGGKFTGIIVSKEGKTIFLKALAVKACQRSHFSIHFVIFFMNFLIRIQSNRKFGCYGLENILLF